MTKYCTVCKQPINPLRVKALPNTTTCVQHSSVEKKAGYTFQFGEGDHTFNDIVIIEPEQRQEFERALQSFKSIVPDSDSLPELNSDDEESNIIFDPINDLDNIDISDESE